ncbi:serpin family protein, partial [Butyricicoccus sp. 1XD8-22]
MNDWVKNATNGKINQIVEPPINPDLVTILINAIYFKGNWTHPFNKEQTEKSIFTLESGNTKEVSLMRLNEKLAYMENEMFQAVSLPYGDNQNLSMKVFLPRENVPISQFEKLLNNTNWEKWKSEFNEKEGTILLPRFQLEYEALLNDTLKTLGMPSAFDNANFSKMIEEKVPLWISKVTQKTFIDVNEEGTEAAAATSVEIVTESASAEMPFYMEVNRP